MNLIITTPNELRMIIEDCLKEVKNIKDNSQKKEYLRSITEIANFLGCSRTKAQQLKNSHPEIFLQTERKFLVDRQDLLDVLRNKKKTKS